MAKTRRKSVKSNRSAVGGGGLISSVVNKAIDLLPFEAHLPGYNYCGPGTKLSKRLARGDKGINGLDEACRFHDIAYSKYSDTANRQSADKQLAEAAWQRFKASDSSVGEKAAAWAVTTAMKAKTAFGKGRRKKPQTRRGTGMYLRPYPKRGAGSKRSNSRVKKRQVKKKSRSR